jgi:hypothetical protein
MPPPLTEWLLDDEELLSKVRVAEVWARVLEEEDPIAEICTYTYATDKKILKKQSAKTKSL